MQSPASVNRVEIPYQVVPKQVSYQRITQGDEPLKRTPFCDNPRLDRTIVTVVLTQMSFSPEALAGRLLKN